MNAPSSAAVAALARDYQPAFERRFLGPRFWPTWLGLALFWCVSWLPRGVRHLIGAWLGRLAFRHHGKRRRIVEINLAWCFPHLSPAERVALARRYFVRMAQTMLDYGLLWWGSRRRLAELIRMRGTEHLWPLVTAGRPVILLTGHGVALDFGAQAISREFVTVGLIKPARNALLEWLITRGRKRHSHQGRLFLREAGIRPVVRAVRAGALFYYLPDEDLGATQDSVFAPFFGVPTATLTALGRMARLTGAVVLPCMAYYLPAEGVYEVRIGPALAGFPGGDELGDATRMNRELEALIAAAPDQYMWSLRLFQTRPAGESSPYE